MIVVMIMISHDDNDGGDDCESGPRKCLACRGSCCNRCLRGNACSQVQR